ncbi:MAG: hypothetical protein KKA62_03120 [Nanoarchaeota archaeon]|nr:hypothetical protein [Nanoarchaeota archaeon]MBU1644022.1 hypothetical protein [Nanoarchaeota archaeon]MBU1976917.1 hypothetical protein [Nanoarchaeota archaeon]
MAAIIRVKEQEIIEIRGKQAKKFAAGDCTGQLFQSAKAVREGVVVRINAVAFVR